MYLEHSCLTCIKRDDFGHVFICTQCQNGRKKLAMVINGDAFCPMCRGTGVPLNSFRKHCICKAGEDLRSATQKQ